MDLQLNHDHVGLATVDLDASIDWYTSKLDFTTVHRFEAHGRTFAFLVNGSAKLELVSGAGSTAHAPVETIADSLDDARLHHFCVATADVDATLDELRARGVTIVGEPFDVPAIQQRIAFVTDNAGNIIELTARI